jgi:serine protease Do
MNMKQSILVVVIIIASCVGGIVGSLFTIQWLNDGASYTSIEQRQNSVLTNYVPDSLYRVPKELNFLVPAEQVASAVVHIQTAYGAGSFSINPLNYLMDRPVHSSGSGVIISDDGFIVTNYHVIEDAVNIEVVMNDNQRYFAKIIGVDPTTDLALLKVKGKNLPFLKYGDSDLTRPGEWVLAVGNPFELNSTVTAGIVSAKARNIGILRDHLNNLQIESFIQTDAAVNPGNSGGALVNLKGELIGVNTAIATSSGNYQGYSFAIPVSLVKKVVDDLLEFGKVQRGLLGVLIVDVDARIAEELKLDVNQGVLINRVMKEGGAADAGLLPGDIILAVEGHAVSSTSTLQERVARFRPGKMISVSYLRDGEKHTVNVLLKNTKGNTEMLVAEIPETLDGIQVTNVADSILTFLELDGGVLVTAVEEGKWKNSGITANFVIAYIDRVPVDHVTDFYKILNTKRGAILIEGYYLQGERRVYALDW